MRRFLIIAAILVSTVGRIFPSLPPFAAATDAVPLLERIRSPWRRVRRQPRRRVGLFAVTAVAVLVASVVGIQLAGAAGSGSGPSVPGTGGVSSATVSGNLKLKVTRASYGYSGAAAPGGVFTSVDAPITFDCASRSTCTFTNEGTVQVDDNGNSWAICLTVDTTHNADCSWVGILPNDGYFTTESVSGTFPGLAPGPHTVVTQVYASTATVIEHFDLKYRSYNP